MGIGILYPSLCNIKQPRFLLVAKERVNEGDVLIFLSFKRKISIMVKR